MQYICTFEHSTYIAEVTENSLLLQVTGQTWDMGTVTHQENEVHRMYSLFITLRLQIFLKGFTQE